MKTLLISLVLLWGGGCDRSKPPNLVLISLDTVRADHCSVYGYGLPTTPVLEKVSAEGVVFDSAYSTTPTTGPSHASLFTGLMPQTHGLRVNGERLETPRRTLAEHLAASGYQTAGIASSFVLSASFGFSRGFSHWNDDLPFEGSKHQSGQWMNHTVRAGFDRRADHTTEVATQWLREFRDPGRPFFLFVHYFEPHGPYVPPEPWLEKFCGVESEPMIPAYDAGLAFTDDEVGRFLRVLEDLGLAEDTLVVITADHGEGLMSHGAMAHGAHLYDEAVHIPLVFRWPAGIQEGRRVQQPVGLPDLAPTILELIGVGDLSTAMDGRSFASSLLNPSMGSDERPVFLFRGSVRRGWVGDREVGGELFGVIDGRWKYTTSQFEGDELFDRNVDAMERQNLASQHTDEVQRLRKLLAPWHTGNSVSEGPEAVLTSEERRGLEALGYLQ